MKDDPVGATTLTTPALPPAPPLVEPSATIAEPDAPLSPEALLRFQAIIDATPDCIFVTDAETNRLLYVNEAACRTTGFHRAELLEVAPNTLLGTSTETLSTLMKDAIANRDGRITLDAHLATSKDGNRKGWWEPHFRAVSVDGRWLVICISREVSARVLAERAAIRAKRLYQTLSAVNEAIMRVRTEDELFRRVCDVAVTVGGFPSAAILLADTGATRLTAAAVAGAASEQISTLQIALPRTITPETDFAASAYRDITPIVCRNVDADPRATSWRVVHDQVSVSAAAALPIVRDRRPIGVLVLCANQMRSFTDETLSLLTRITENLAFALQNIEREAERQRAEERVRHLATHDALTGLPNRLLFGELLSSAVQHAARYDEQLAVMFIDLDHFKHVNDTLGHSAGDLLLTEVSARLRRVLRSSDVVARLGGDEFVVLASDLNGSDDATTIAVKLLEAALMPVSVMGNDCQVSASIGISLFPAHATDDKALLHAADAAMYDAKRRGKNSFALYEPHRGITPR
jgi:diguanylate cyclase (GGDEF)-like protein/PAS domain S-box-containing protein